MRGSLVPFHTHQRNNKETKNRIWYIRLTTKQQHESDENCFWTPPPPPYQTSKRIINNLILSGECVTNIRIHIWTYAFVEHENRLTRDEILFIETQSLITNCFCTINLYVSVWVDCVLILINVISKSFVFPHFTSFIKWDTFLQALNL